MQSDVATILATLAPIAYWDGSTSATTLLDVAGGSDASAAGSPTPGQTGADGATASAFDCDGVSGNNYYDTGGDPFGGAAVYEFTTGAWVYATSTPDGSGVITDPLGSDGAAGLLLGAGVDIFAGSNLGGGQDEFGRYVIEDFSSMSTAVWIFVCLTFSAFSGNAFQLYIDGSLVNTSGGGYNASGYNLERVHLGNWADSSGSLPTWPGLIDQPFIFDRELTSSDVDNIYQAMLLPPSGGGLSVSPAGLASGFQAPGGTLELNVSGAGAVATGEAVGAAGVGLNVDGAGVGSGEAIGTSLLELNVTGIGLPSGEAVGAHTVNGGVIVPPTPKQLPTLGAG